MTEQTNVSKLVLDHVITQSAAGGSTSLYDLAEQTGFDVDRLAQCESELYPAVNCGTSARFPWPWDKSEARACYEKWDADPPERFDEANWTDTVEAGR